VHVRVDSYCLASRSGGALDHGPNIDWLGRIVEQQRGKRLGDVMNERIFAPLGMSDIGFTMSESMKARRAKIHDRAADGKLTPLPELALPQPPEMDCGGHGLYGSVGEYMTFIRMLLNDGVGRNGRVLKAETVGQTETVEGSELAEDSSRSSQTPMHRGATANPATRYIDCGRAA
jgi:methyl acetate hydrolase